MQSEPRPKGAVRSHKVKHYKFEKQSAATPQLWIAIRFPCGFRNACANPRTGRPPRAGRQLRRSQIGNITSSKSKARQRRSSGSRSDSLAASEMLAQILEPVDHQEPAVSFGDLRSETLQVRKAKRGNAAALDRDPIPLRLQKCLRKSSNRSTTKSRPSASAISDRKHYKFEKQSAATPQLWIAIRFPCGFRNACANPRTGRPPRAGRQLRRSQIGNITSSKSKARQRRSSGSRSDSLAASEMLAQILEPVDHQEPAVSFGDLRSETLQVRKAKRGNAAALDRDPIPLRLQKCLRKSSNRSTTKSRPSASAI